MDSAVCIYIYTCAVCVCVCDNDKDGKVLNLMGGGGDSTGGTKIAKKREKVT